MSVDLNPSRGSFAEVAKYFLLADGKAAMAARMAEDRRASARVVTTLREAVGVGVLSDPTYAGGLAGYRGLQETFIASLRNHGVFDRLLGAGLIRVPLRSRLVAETVAATGSVTEEGKPKSIARFTLAQDALAPRKASCIVALSREIADSMSPAATAFLSRQLRRGVVAATDGNFLALVGAVAAKIEGSGGTATDIRADIAAMLAAIDTGDDSTLYLVISSGRAKSLSAKADTAGAAAFPGMAPGGGEVCGISTLVSDQIASIYSGESPAFADTALLLDASGIAADSDVITLDSARHAAIRLDTAPSTQDATDGTGTELTSLWQTDAVALRVERWYGAAAVRPNIAAAADASAW